MERRVNKRIQENYELYKNFIKTTMLASRIELVEYFKENSNNTNTHEDYISSKILSTLQKIYDYEIPILKAEDFQKRKRTKNTIPLHIQCHAKRANGCQCSRRKKEGSIFCGTHIKGTPHGFINVSTETTETNSKKKVEVWLEDIMGIFYYIDNNNNVYETQDIIKSVDSPKIIAKYEKMLLESGELSYNIIKE